MKLDNVRYLSLSHIFPRDKQAAPSASMLSEKAELVGILQHAVTKGRPKGPGSAKICSVGH